MHILFAHDVPLLFDKNTQKMYSITFDYQLWKRYLNISSHLVVATRWANDQSEEINKYKLSSGKNVEFIEIPSLSNPKNRMKNIKLAKLKLEKELSNVDGVVVRLPSEIGLLTLKLASKMNLPIAIEMVGCPEDSYKYHGSLLGRMYSPIAKRKYKKVIGKSKYTLYVTDEFLQKKYPSKGFTSSASNVVISSNKDNKYTSRKEKSTSKIVLGTIGSLDVNYKGLDTAIKCMELLKEYSKEYKIYLEVIGGGDKTRWENLAKQFGVENLIIFKGKLNKGEIKEWLQTVDIYIQPSKTEGLPRTVIEAMNEGVPVVASNVGGIPELIDSKFLHNSLDYHSMAKLVLKLCTDKSIRNEQSQKNYLRSLDFEQKKLQEARRAFYEKFSLSFKKKVE